MLADASNQSPVFLKADCRNKHLGTLTELSGLPPWRVFFLTAASSELWVVPGIPRLEGTTKNAVHQMAIARSCAIHWRDSEVCFLGVISGFTLHLSICFIILIPCPSLWKQNKTKQKKSTPHCF